MESGSVVAWLFDMRALNHSGENRPQIQHSRLRACSDFNERLAKIRCPDGLPARIMKTCCPWPVNGITFNHLRMNGVIL